MAEKKLTRKELLKSPDEFLTFSERAYEYIRLHSKQFGTGLLIVVVALLLFFGTRTYLSYAAAQAQAAYNQASADLTIQGELDQEQAAQAAGKLEEFVKDYPGSDPARYALIDLGSLYYRLGKYQEAQKAYESFLDDMEPYEYHIRPFVLDSLAFCYEMQDMYTEAIATWNELLLQPGDTLKQGAYVNLGRVYLKNEQPEEARRAYEQLISEYPDSPSADLGRYKLAALAN